MTYRDAWKSVAAALLPQALAGAPALELESGEAVPAGAPAFTATLSGDLTGSLTVALEPALLEMSLVGEGMDQRAGWLELLREVAESAAGELLAKTGRDCRVTSFTESPATCGAADALMIRSAAGAWRIWVLDATQEKDSRRIETPASGSPVAASADLGPPPPKSRPGIELLLDIELEATIRFGSRELPLGEILELGPGDVVELDRRVSDPVDLIVGDKIVAQGEVVLLNGSFGLRITAVAEPQKRLESIRCLF